MRPILMTALATIFALLVMALGVGGGSNMLQPLAVVCIGGLAYGTLMTLFVVPIIYDALNKKELRKIDAEDLVVDKDA
jgi:HAE1 family hydrophobic/amphiphilic exporter-1